MANPHVEAWRRQRANRGRVDGVGARVLALLVPLVACGILLPLLRPVFFTFLALEPAQWAEGAAAVSLRAGLLVVAILSLDLYSALIRGSSRPVLAILPVDPNEVVRAEILAVAARRWWLVPGLGVLMAPLLLAGAPLLWALSMWVVASAMALGLVVSAWLHLRAVDAAEDPAWANVLDRVRGSNPREQAAFIYAPGVIIGVCGTAVWAASEGVRLAAAADPMGAVWLLAPLPLVVYAAFTLERRAQSWFTGGLVLAEIDARYAAFEDPEESSRVYLDWVVRWLPDRMAVYALKDLRHGWRARRTWISGAWLFGLGALAAGWTTSELGPVRAADVALAAAWLCAGIGVLLQSDEPDFLVAWLPDGGLDKRAARLLVLLLWVQPPAWLGAASVLIRRGAGDALLVLAVGQVSGLVAGLTAVACGALGRRGLAVYAPVGAVAAGASAFWLGL